MLGLVLIIKKRKMAKIVIATVKTDKQIIIDGVNREKIIFGSASEVCERALKAYFEPKKVHEFSNNDLEENRLSTVCSNINVNDCSSLHTIASENGLLMPDLCSIILARFCRGEIQFYDQARTAVNEPITAVNLPINEPITAENLPVSNDQENVIIKISTLLIPEVRESLIDYGFDELRYYTVKKERETNQQFSKLIQEIKHEHQEEINYFAQRNDELKTNDSDVEELVKSTKILVNTLCEKSINPFITYKKSDVLAIFSEKLRPIFQ